MRAAEVLTCHSGQLCCSTMQALLPQAAAGTGSHCRRAAAKIMGNSNNHKLHNRRQGAPVC